MYENKIVGTGTEHPEQLLANPNNWRIHPKGQQDALESLLDDVGWVQNIIVNQRTGPLGKSSKIKRMGTSQNRITAGFKYVGPIDFESAKTLQIV